MVFDVGANVGVSAAFFAANCGAFVHSFEPVRPIYEILLENVRRLPRCSAHNLGLSSHPRHAPITYYPNADAMSGLYADPRGRYGPLLVHACGTSACRWRKPSEASKAGTTVP